MPAATACAGATTQALTATDGKVAERIYRDELEGPGAIHDREQVEAYEPLLAALAEGNRLAIHEAVVALVYSHTHIVRLRISQGGALLADVGGPYIIAPTGGNLYYRGRLVGSYLLSVQDDRGVVGLERRLESVPLVLHVGRSRVPLGYTLQTGSVPLPDEGQVTLGGHLFQAYSFDAKAYPAGTVRISLLHPLVPPSTRTCEAVRIAEIGRIGRSIWYRFTQDKAPISGFVSYAQRITGAPTYVRAGASEIAGSTQASPTSIPASGELRFGGVTYGVASFAETTPTGTVRVYQLVALHAD
ncbi:MAG TPA: hypothetical protein VHT29_15255 [Solirubrobacteraceae bacterium]|nr:hypothetical protein [Solirubrobacteraceae bacterium]